MLPIIWSKELPNFHFHIEANSDEAGVELSDLETAKHEAVRYLGNILSSEAARFWDSADLVLTVSDETGLTLFELHVSVTEAPVLMIEKAQTSGVRK